MKRQTESFQKLVGNDDDEGAGSSFFSCNKKWCWWAPRQNTLPVAFCNETSIHGLKFLGQEKRHISERIFWLVGFFLSVGTAIYLIYNVWNRYETNPVIVTYQSQEQNMATMPFPAVTLCNMNKFPKSEVEKLKKVVQSASASPEEKRVAKRQLAYVRNICNAQQSLAKEMKYAFHRGGNLEEQDENDTVITDEGQVEMTDFLLKNTLPCGELVRLCMLGEQVKNCSKLFRPIVTDYGKCCTFNILPLPLLTKNPKKTSTRQKFFLTDRKNENKKNASIYDNPVLGSLGKETWPEEELKEWDKWNYDLGFKLDGSLQHPWRQKRSGLPYGLSMLLDPNLDDYHCPASDSYGLRYILHTPLEMPRVMSFSSVVHMEKEILIEVHPDVTNADVDIRQIDHKKRLCFFGREKSLRFFGPYTSGNCIDECMGKLLAKKCNCSLFYMPREGGVRTCNSDPTSEDHLCIENAQTELQTDLKASCPDCGALCEDIAYNYETTIAEIQNASGLWLDPDPAYIKDPPEWAKHNMSVVHIFFGAESTVPKFRKRMYGPMDLIANTGGILGLCLGFSILSGVEVIYFITLRSFWKHCRKRMLKRKQQHQGNHYLGQAKANLHSHTIIPVYPVNDAMMKAKSIRQNYQQSRDAAIPSLQLANAQWKWGNNQGHHFYGANSSFQQ